MHMVQLCITFNLLTWQVKCPFSFSFFYMVAEGTTKHAGGTTYIIQPFSAVAHLACILNNKLTDSHEFSFFLSSMHSTAQGRFNNNLTCMGQLNMHMVHETTVAAGGREGKLFCYLL